jgi:hypothetical protein
MGAYPHEIRLCGPFTPAYNAYAGVVIAYWLFGRISAGFTRTYDQSGPFVGLAR